MCCCVCEFGCGLLRDVVWLLILYCCVLVCAFYAFACFAAISCAVLCGVLVVAVFLSVLACVI